MIEGEVVSGFDRAGEAGLGPLEPLADVIDLEGRPRSPVQCGPVPLPDLLAMPDFASLVASRVVPELVRRRLPEPEMFLREKRDRGPFDRRTVETFVELLFDGFGTECEEFVLDLFEQVKDPQAIAARLLDPAAVEAGRRWCAETGDFLRVTYAVCRIQRLFWKMVCAEPARRPLRPRGCALLAPVPGEQHTFALSIVEDALRRAGWEVDTCTHGEEDEMFRLAGANHYAFVGLSLGGAALLPAFERAAARLRRRSLNRDIPIVAGGSLFREQPLLAFAAGADHVCADAAAAVRLAESILALAEGQCHMHVAAE